MKDRIDIRTGYLCNNNCRFCVFDEEEKILEMSTDEVKKQLDYAKKNGAPEITFTGGEPTIRPDIIELIEYAKKLGFVTIMLTTNARRFRYPDFTREVIGAGANKFMISLHAPNAELHDYLTRSPGSFEQTVSGIKNLLSAGQRVVVNLVINKLNYKTLPTFVEFVYSRGVKCLQLTFVMPFGNAKKYEKLIVPSLTDVKKYLHRAIEKSHRLGMELIIMNVPPCFARGYEHHLNELNMRHKNMEIIAPNPNHSSKDYVAHKRMHKIKASWCQNCEYNPKCEGLWKEYVKIRGFK